jgi:hypothetical protein
VDRGPHHEVLKESKVLVRFKKELQTALKNWESFKRPVASRGRSSICPFDSTCESFSEDSYLCRRPHYRKYCEKYKRMNKMIRGV